MSSNISPHLQALAEAVSPLSHSLAAGLLVRPLAVPFMAATDDAQDDADSVERICQDLDAMLKENVPLMRGAMSLLRECDEDELEELVDELAAAALELVDMSRRIWAAALPESTEGARALLATLAEAPASQLLQWVLEVMHTVLDPWSIAENPEDPQIAYELAIPDGPVRKALSKWKAAHPGVLPEELLV